MNTPFHQHGYVALNGSESFAKVKRSTSIAAASNRAPRSELQAIALRTFSAGGFGDADIGHASPLDALNSYQLHQQARAHRSYRLAEVLESMQQAAADIGRRLAARWKRQRFARATYHALRQLDTRTLRDLGFDRSELLSVAAELAGNADPSRARAFGPIATHVGQ